MSYLSRVFKEAPKKTNVKEEEEKIIFPEKTPVMLEIQKVREIISNDKQYFSIDCMILDGEYKGKKTDIFFPTISGNYLSITFKIILEAFLRDKIFREVEKVDNGEKSDEELDNMIINLFMSNLGEVNGALVKATFSESCDYTDKKGKKRQGQYLDSLKVMAKPDKDTEF